MPRNSDERRREQISHLVKKLIECRNDLGFNRVREQLQKILHSNVARLPYGDFLERYLCGDSALHIHALLWLRKRRFNLCAVLQTTTGVTGPSAVKSQDFAVSNISDGEIKMTVFVNIRQVGKPSHNFRSASTVVRLNTLNECKRAFGNTRKCVSEVLLGDRRLSYALGEFESQREVAVFLPRVRKNDSSAVEFDQIERQMIQSGTELIENFPSENSDVLRRRLPNIKCGFAVRVSDELIRLTAAVSANASLNGLDVFRCPDEFELRRP